MLRREANKPDVWEMGCSEEEFTSIVNSPDTAPANKQVAYEQRQIVLQVNKLDIRHPEVVTKAEALLETSSRDTAVQFYWNVGV